MCVSDTIWLDLTGNIRGLVDLAEYFHKLSRLLCFGFFLATFFVIGSALRSRLCIIALEYLLACRSKICLS